MRLFEEGVRGRWLGGVGGGEGKVKGCIPKTASVDNVDNFFKTFWH